ncbi:calcium-binding protein [Nocardioides sp. MH1]|uniref:calcium-binding protein n=1 Tax=Nocardioides sp. MH1 TaxID=3242490 RepID=UPI003521E7CB
MKRWLIALALVAPALLVPTVASSSAPAGAVQRPTCAGRPVTIDLNRAGAPDPDRRRSDVILGTPHRDRFRTGGGDDVVCAGRGADRVLLGKGEDTAYGGPGDDFLDGGDRSDHLNGGAGGDSIWGRGGWDQLEQSGLSRGADAVYGGAGNDTMRNATAGDLYYGGADRDFFTDAADCGSCDPAVAIFYLGGGGNDLLVSGGGKELLNGGDGSDTVSYVGLVEEPGPGVTVDLEVAAPQATGPGGTDILQSIENLVGSSEGDDVLSGDDGPNRLAGGNGADQLFGRGGDDDLEGGDGADLCDGGAGTNQYDGCEEST